MKQEVEDDGFITVHPPVAEGGYASGGGFAMPCGDARQSFRMFADFTGADPRYRDVAPEAGTSEPTTTQNREAITRAANGEFDPVPSYEEQRADQLSRGVAMRFNAGKLRFDLIPPDALEVLASIYTMGAAKYADRNWEKGFDWMSCAASLERHYNDWKKGIDRDPESGELHMGHVAWNAFALIAFQLRNVGRDDRVKLVPLD